jgi:membrane-associated phospholipid phosphatase
MPGHTSKLISFRHLVLDNRVFLGTFSVFFIATLALSLTLAPAEEIFYFNARRTPVWDLFFRLTTKMGEGYIVVLTVLALLFSRFRFAVAAPAMGITAAVVTQTIKRYFAHPRPYAFLRDNGLLEQLEPVPRVLLHSGATSFPSGHTLTAFAFCALLAFCLPKKGGTALLLFFLAAAVALSRIYLAQHFMKDVCLGALLGVALAAVFYLLAQRLPAARHPWLDKRLTFSAIYKTLFRRS